jgi:7,8-dihydropterin-6-yl-methyl-4-(beta-D-ribofuranosyl)aminobenzene 5'-phosphate synthase
MINNSRKGTPSIIIIFILFVNAIITGYISYIYYNPGTTSIENNIPVSDNYELRGTSILKTQNLSELGEIESVDLTVLADNYPHGGLSALWGLSILIETDNSTVLIDTGQSYSVLRGNSLALNKDLSEVDFVVISHEHWDHIGGLSYVEEVNPGVTVYVPSLMDTTTFNNINQSNLNVIRINETTIVQRGFAIIGELYGPPYEQALAVNIKDVELVSFMGCSHPGVDNIIEKAITDLGYETYMVIGGFHMGSATEQQIEDTIGRLIELGVNRIFPIHCSGDAIRQYMAEYYPQQYGQANVGFHKTVNKFTINLEESFPMIFAILISAIVISLTVLASWFIRKKRVKRT